MTRDSKLHILGSVISSVEKMPAYLSKGELVSYITHDGIQQSKVVSMAKIKDRLYYRLENGDYVADTHYGLVRTVENKDLLKSFGELYGGTSWQQ